MKPDAKLTSLPFQPSEIHSFIKPYYTKSAVTAGGPEAAALSLACRRLQIRATIGYAERDHGSLYMSQWMIGPDGSIVSRRKLKPSLMERVVFGEGNVSAAAESNGLVERADGFVIGLQGSDLLVLETEIGRVGALQCWVSLCHVCLRWPSAHTHSCLQEHTQLLIKHSLAVQHEEVRTLPVSFRSAAYFYYPPTRSTALPGPRSLLSCPTTPSASTPTPAPPRPTRSKPQRSSSPPLHPSPRPTRTSPSTATRACASTSPSAAGSARSSTPRAGRCARFQRTMWRTSSTQRSTWTTSRSPRRQWTRSGTMPGTTCLRSRSLGRRRGWWSCRLGVARGRRKRQR